MTPLGSTSLFTLRARLRPVIDFGPGRVARRITIGHGRTGDDGVIDDVVESN